MAFYVLFENKNTFLFLYFICLLLNLQMYQIIFLALYNGGHLEHIL